MAIQKVKERRSYVPITPGSIFDLTDLKYKLGWQERVIFSKLTEIGMEGVDLGGYRVLMLHEELESAIRKHKKPLKKKR